MQVCVCARPSVCAHMCAQAISPRRCLTHHFIGCNWANTFFSTTLKGGFDQAERLAPRRDLAPGQRALALWEEPPTPKAGLEQLSLPSPLGSLPEWLGLCGQGPDWEACQGSTLSSCQKCQGMGRALTLSHSTRRDLFKVSFLLCRCRPCLRNLD